MDFLIVGLGNPGAEYERTRHNAGWMALDRWLETWRLEQGQPTQPWQNHPKTDSLLTDATWLQPPRRLLKPQTFMNDSGRAVQKALKWFNIVPEFGTQYRNLIVVHDDLDLELGMYKLQFGRGPKQHNGLLSLYQHLNTDAFWSVRIGVDSRQGDRTLSGRDYVLQPFTPSEKTTLTTVFDRARQQLEHDVLVLQ